MELLHKMAKHNNFATFKKAFIEEFGIGKWLAILAIMDSINHGKYDQLMQMCCDLYSSISSARICIDDLKGDRKFAAIVEARQLAMFFLMTYSPLTLEAIGGLFNKDHSTVHWAKSVIPTRIEHKSLLIPIDVYFEANQMAQKILGGE